MHFVMTRLHTENPAPVCAMATARPEVFFQVFTLCVFFSSRVGVVRGFLFLRAAAPAPRSPPARRVRFPVWRRRGRLGVFLSGELMCPVVFPPIGPRR
jgi:hypothetical protein